MGSLTTPRRDRFGIPIRLEFYTEEELLAIVRRGARVIQIADSDTIAASLSEARDAIAGIVEPYLLQLGFLNRTPRGRPAAW